MRPAIISSLIALAACQDDWRAKAIVDAEGLVRQHVGAPSITFAHVRVTGDSATGQTCGYYERPYYGGGVSRTRFIAFIDGAGGRNPYIDDTAAPFPADSADFALNWRTQCLDLGYRE